MSRFHTRIEVPRGILETFAFVSDFSNAGRWDPNVESASMLTPGPIGLATMFQLVGRLYLPFTRIKPPLIGEFTLPYQVVVFDPPPEQVGTEKVTARTPFGTENDAPLIGPGAAIGAKTNDSACLLLSS